MEPADRVSEGMPVHRWKPIEDLPTDRSALSRAAAEVVALRRAWADEKKRLEDSGALKEFNARLSRQWCIETGILEGIYTLDRGATTTLIEHGFDAALLSHGETNVGEQTLIRILRDHQEAIDGLFAFVKQDRPLTTSYVKALHQVLVAHQADIEVLDGQGRLSRLPLRKGDWKLMPNNPGDPRTLELVHEYSPPEEVAAEMDRLVAMHATHDGVEAEISAAWLHHRFVQIHPFQDGNGRVARALATLVLIQRGGFPLVVLRDDKNVYIDALRAADGGDLLPLVEFVCRLQKAALLRATEYGDAVLDSKPTITAILEDVSRRTQAAVSKGRDEVEAITEELRDATARRMAELKPQIEEAAAALNGVSANVMTSNRTTERRFERFVHAVANALGYQADTTLRPLWAQLQIVHGADTNIIVSFHRLGSPAASVMAASAFVVAPDLANIQPVCAEPFTITADRPRDETRREFGSWLEHSLTIGLELWRRSL